MTSRAMLLPTTGDPYICAAWVNSYKKYCQEHVDKLYVTLNSPAEERVYNYVKNMFAELGADIICNEDMYDHGPSITDMLDICNEEVVFLAEDDFLIQDPNCLGEWYKAVEDGEWDILASMRGCTSQELIAAEVRQFNITGEARHQPNFWPALLVTKTETLRATDMHFGAKVFEAGEYIEPLDYTPKETSGADTFVWASMQLRAMDLKIKLIPHHRWIDVLISKVNGTPWIHVGSSSCSFNGFLLDENSRPIPDPSSMNPREYQVPPDDGLRRHFEEMLSGWQVKAETFPIPEDDPASYFNEVYLDAIKRGVEGMTLNPSRMKMDYQTVKKLLQPSLTP